ncbi:hypothetical protein CRYUN_Cryun07bG0075300 [Craigia yunnanensis]
MIIDTHFLALTAIITVGYQICFFIIAALLKFDKVNDFAGSTNFIVLSLLTLVIKGSWHFRQVVLTLLIVIWSLRLALFLVVRILQWGEDRRYKKMRSNLGTLAVFYIFQERILSSSIGFNFESERSHLPDSKSLDEASLQSDHSYSWTCSHPASLKLPKEVHKCKS